MIRILYLIRGVSGSGKSALGELIADKVFEADKFFVKDGTYKFEPSSIKEAHRFCQEGCWLAMTDGIEKIAVCNTFTKEEHLKPYLDMAEQAGYNVVSIVVENRHGNNSVHGVPENTINRQEKELRNNLKLK